MPRKCAAEREAEDPHSEVVIVGVLVQRYGISYVVTVAIMQETLDARVR